VDPDPHGSALMFCRMDFYPIPGGQKWSTKEGKSEEILGYEVLEAFCSVVEP
jgi:hypothetical protein